MRSILKHLLLLSRTGSSVSPPVNTALPAISGTVLTGQTLTVSDGTWTGADSFTYQWKRDGVAIGGATNSTYVLVAADEGAVITATVTATNAGGSTDATSTGVNTLNTSLAAGWEINESSDGTVSVVRQEYFNLVDFPDANTVASGTIEGENSAHFVGLPEYLTGAYNASVDCDGGLVTGAVVVKFDTLAANQVLYMSGNNRGSAAQYAWALVLAAGVKPQLAVSDGSVITNVAGLSNLATSTRYTIVFWIDSANDVIGIQTNNDAGNTAAFTGTIKAGNFPIHVGGDSSATAGRYMLGDAKKVDLWLRVLTANERTAWHNGGLGSSPPFLV